MVFKTLNLKLDSWEKLKELSERSTIPMARIVKSIIDEIFILTHTFDGIYNLDFVTDLADNELKILVRPRIRVVEEKIPKEILEQESMGEIKDADI